MGSRVESRKKKVGCPRAAGWHLDGSPVPIGRSPPQTGDPDARAHPVPRIPRTPAPGRWPAWRGARRPRRPKRRRRGLRRPRPLPPPRPCAETAGDGRPAADGGKRRPFSQKRQDGRRRRAASGRPRRLSRLERQKRPRRSVRDRGRPAGAARPCGRLRRDNVRVRIRSGSFRFPFKGVFEFAPQEGAGLEETLPRRSLGNAERGGDFGVRTPGPVAQENRLAVSFGKPGHRDAYRLGRPSGRSVPRAA